jgi:hypothetical protein
MMATRIVLQRDRTSNNLFAKPISDTSASAVLLANTVTTIEVPTRAHIAFVTVTGNEAYVALNETPVVPTTANFVFQPGQQINNGAMAGFPCNPGDDINIISDNTAKVQVSFYENEYIQ